MHEPGQEIISSLAVNDHPFHFQVVTGLPVAAADTSATDPHALFYCGIHEDAGMLRIVFSIHVTSIPIIKSVPDSPVLF